MAVNGFKVLEDIIEKTKDDALKCHVAELEKVANENAKAMLQFAGMRDALNTLSRPEIEQLIKDTIVEHNTLNKIELKTPEETKMLKDEPRHYLFPELMQTVSAGIPSALIGPAGSGKSTVCEQVADALTLPFYLQNAVSGTHELTGYMDAHGNYHGTTFRTAFEHGGFFFIDEVDTSDPGAIKWLNTALANGYAMFPDKPDRVLRHKDFRAVIAANTFGNGADRIYVGANQLDASTLDRFVFFDFRYDTKLEMLLSGGNTKWCERVQAIREGALKEKARMVISPRATIYGAKLLALGWDQNVVEDRVIWKGTDKDLKERILKHAGPITLREEKFAKAVSKPKKGYN